MKVKLIGYAPDADPTIPGILLDCSAIIPTQLGFKAAFTPLSTTLPALAAACHGAAVVRKLDGTSRFFASTATKLYEDASTSWTDRTRASGGDYNAASDQSWSFSQYNDVTLAVNKADTLQFSTTAAFANVTGAPKAKIVETVNEFVFLFDTNEAIYGDISNRWWCAAQGNYTDWTPSTATNCYTGTLTSSPGGIMAGKKFGDNIVVYKAHAMYLGYFAGSPNGWKFSQIPGETGALCNNVVVDVGTADSPKHIFMGYDDFYMFDGTRPVPLGANVVKDTIYGELNRQYSHCSFSMLDTSRNIIYFYYPASASQIPNKCVVYNYRTNTWGRDDRIAEAAVNYVGGGITYTSLGTYFSTYDDLPSVRYDSAFSFVAEPITSIFDSAHLLKTLTGAATDSSMTTGDYGDDTVHTFVRRVKPRFITAPVNAILVNYFREELSDSLIPDQTVTISNNRFDFMRDARWHRARVSFTGDMEIIGLDVDSQESGLE